MRTVEAPAELRAVAELLAPVRPLPVDLLHELVTTGSPVTAAFDGDRPVGATAGFLTGAGLHSYVTVVIADRRRQGVGSALKWHQREWALGAGLGTVTWTFDPNDVACARLSVRTLGAEVTSYQRGFGPGGDDRLVVTWALRSARVTQAWHGVDPVEVEPQRACAPGPDLAVAIEGGCHVLDVAEDGTYLLRGPG